MIADSQKINARYILITALAVLFSWELHEFAHWTTGKLLGYKMIMTLNKTSFEITQGSPQWYQHLVSAAGPLVTIIEAITVFFIMKSRKKTILYPFLFTCFYMRFFAAVISIIHPNDEARISNAIGIGTFTLPAIITVFLFFLICKISKQYSFSFKFNLLNLALVIAFSSIIILTDQFYHVIILQ